MYYYPMQQRFMPFLPQMWNQVQQFQPQQPVYPQIPKNTASVPPSATLPKKPAPSRKIQTPKPEQFTAQNLSQENLDKIVSKYGVDIEDIYRLSPGQKWMFGRARKVTNAFFLQMFFTVTMDLKPAGFRQKLDEVSLKRTNLRTAFAYRDLDEPYQVVLKNRRPELRFIDRSDKTLDELRDELEDFRVADRRRGFDLENDPLLRIAIFKTAEKDTYAIISSQPHINDDGASEMLIFKEIFVDYALGDKITLPDMGTASYQNYAKWLEGIDLDGELQYWKALLHQAPETHIPGRVPTMLEPDIDTLMLTFEPEEDALIAGLQARYGATLNSIAQAAWAVMLQKIYNVKDVVFGSITSGRSSEVKGNNQMTGGFVNAFPVRVQAESDETFSALVKRIQLQILQSQEKAHFSPDELGKRLGMKAAAFDHLLNFHNFSGATGKAMPSIPGFKILGMENFDNLSTGFCLYFQLREGKLHCLFSYDRNSFTERKMRLLMDCYRKVFQQILADKDADITVGNIECPDISSFLSAEKDEAEELKHLQLFLRWLSLFEGVDDSGIISLSKHVKIRNYVDSDEILKEDSVPGGLQIIMKGFVESFRTAKNGWIGSLMLLKPGDMISAAGVLEGTPSYIGANAASDEVRVAYIPKDSMKEFIESYPQVALNIIREEEATARRLSFFWINAN